MITGKQFKIPQLIGLAIGITLLTPVLAADFITPTPWSTVVSSDLSRLMPQDELKPLLAGDTEFLSLYRQHMSAQQRGVVLIIPDWQHLPTDNDGINFLRTQLNDLGYATLAMTVPDIDWQAVPTEAENPQSKPANSNQTESDNNDDSPTTPPAKPVHVEAIAQISNAIIDNYKLNLIARFNALYQSALNEDGKIVVIAQGASAAVLLEHYAQYPSTNIDAFISLSSYLPNSQRNQQLNATISTISPPLLDIYYSVDNPDLLLSVADRKRWVKRHSKYDYRQRELFGLRSEPQQHERLTKEVDGFLRRLF
ncbi:MULTISPECIES: DUF3530 family protein [Pseudoalteromonas]|uniref:DUF3530 family protein n=1 Tax=Pseudoalteromonas haloplanktis TaxID=228 RepID=A0ABU1BC12_PSEHA|nr:MULTISPECIES: DUF3530 family protein [Pseudoalteromonas]MCF6143919.1 hypothetical protein [Pseudoalteromonas mariniglutinosa NCIMB 1770]MDQ9092029.1 DUF3530 family protein [Pseudoalteromonas haloplanktis]TMN70512.1 DUF3530 domain-containing protein [Pseudoalteromonas sp. S1727]BDF93316.1 hypothetical protein KAN5_01540 [Pseudoalteromonas sp. KAN5]